MILHISRYFVALEDFSHGHRRRQAVSFTLTESGRDDGGTLSEKSAGAGHRAVSLHRDCVFVSFHKQVKIVCNILTMSKTPGLL